ncbi:MAG: homoserine kinase [Candidatus Aminicenantales bacterium]
MKNIVLKAPATIANFGPGFDIFSLALEKPNDIVKVGLNNTNSISIRIKGEEGEIPLSAAENTAGLAAAHFMRRVKISAGVEIEIEKGMQSCSGLGSSGASAAASVYALNELLDTELEANELIDIARQGEVVSGGSAHADNVAGCLLGGFVLIRSYDPLDAVKIEVPPIPLVMCVIKKTRRTTRGLIPESIGLEKVTRQMAYCASLIHALVSGDLEWIGKAVNNDLISEPARSTSIPGYDEIKKKVLDAGAYGFNISGGGSSIFAICDEKKRDEVAEVLREFSRQFVPESEVIITRASNAGLRKIDGL